MPNISWFDWAVLAIAFGVLFKGQIGSLVGKLMVGSHKRHELHSEVHGILEAVTKQAGSMAHVRDNMGVFVTYIQSAEAVHLDVLREIRDAMALKASIAETGSAQRLKLWAEQVASIQDMQKAQQEQTASTKVLAHLMEQEAMGRAGNLIKDGDAWAALLAVSREQLDATKKLDDRLFEFINSTRRIMKAIEGVGNSDDDDLIESAKDIRMRAAEKGIELSLEQALARAREQANYRR
jgi:pyruvate/2-oxoglutarate dehydrogenase complex dihydrolipoamide acyltransferase (E2) component